MRISWWTSLSPKQRLVVGVAITLLILLCLVLASAEPEQADDSKTDTIIQTTTSVAPTTSASNELPSTNPPPLSASTGKTAIPPIDHPELAALQIGDPQYQRRYDRNLFPTWLDFDGNGCNARQDVLVQESLTPPTKRGCTVLSGTWYSVYDNVTLTNPADVDIDHLVPLADAWRSGAWAWDAERRARFANETRDNHHLVAVTRSSNRQKSDSPPSQWRPTNDDSWCWYASAWLSVKVKWQLTATNAERDALGQMLERC